MVQFWPGNRRNGTLCRSGAAASIDANVAELIFPFLVRNISLDTSWFMLNTRILIKLSIKSSENDKFFYSAGFTSNYIFVIFHLIATNIKHFSNVDVRDRYKSKHETCVTLRLTNVLVQVATAAVDDHVQRRGRPHRLRQELLWWRLGRTERWGQKAQTILLRWQEEGIQEI